MAKIEINKVSEVLKAENLSPAVLRRILETLNLAAQPAASDEDKAPQVKKQFVILISDPDGLLPKTDFVGWVLQVPEVESVATTQERIFKSAYDWNASKKGSRFPVKLVGEALEHVPAKAFKDAGLWVKTKTPVLMLRTDNAIPGTDNQMELPRGVETSAAA